jgi:glycosyltransferase involved in cell wall biosynthesis
MLAASASRRAGGVLNALQPLCHALRGHRVVVSVFAGRDSDTDKDLETWNGVQVETFDVRGPASFGYLPGLRRRLIDDVRADLLHVHGLWMYHSYAAYAWTKSTRRPHVVSPHGMLEPWAIRNSGWKKALASAVYEQRNLQTASCLHALTFAELQDMRALGLKKPVAVIPNGVALPHGNSSPPPSWGDCVPCGAKVLLYLGRLHQKKGIELLLRSWAQPSVKHHCSREGWHLVIAGWGEREYTQKLRALASALGIDENAHFVGPQFGVAKDATFRRATAFALTSFSEGLPMAVLEAWSHGLPSLITPECNLPEGFDAGVAIKVDTDVDSVAEGLVTLFGISQQCLAEVSARALRLIKERFTPEHMGRQMADVYRWAIGGGPTPSCIVSD